MNRLLIFLALLVACGGGADEEIDPLQSETDADPIAGTTDRVPNLDDPECEAGWEFVGDQCRPPVAPGGACDSLICGEGSVCREGQCVSACEATACGGGEACWMDGPRPFCKKVLDMNAPNGGPHPMEGKTLVLPKVLLGGSFIHPPGAKEIIFNLSSLYGSIDMPIVMFQLHDFDSQARSAQCEFGLAEEIGMGGAPIYALWDWRIPFRAVPDFSYKSNPVFEIKLVEQHIEVDVNYFITRIDNLHLTGTTDRDDPTLAQVRATGRLDLNPIESFLTVMLGQKLDLCEIFSGCNAHRTIQVNLDAIEARWEDLDIDAIR